jgi:hypothetical protein
MTTISRLLPWQKIRKSNYIGGKPEFVPDTKPETTDPPYVHERLKKFIDFFEEHREMNRAKERKYVYLTIIIGAFISVVNVFTVFDLRETQILVSITSAILGAVVTIMVGILQHEKYHQRWVHLKVVATRLRVEYYLWKNRVGVYSCEKGDDTRCKESDYKINVLVERCEDIILKEALEYAEMFTEPGKKSVPPESLDNSKKT